MTHRRKRHLGPLALMLGLLLCLALAGPNLADPNLPMSYQPLGNAFLNMPGYDWAGVHDEAKRESTTQPCYKSNGEENVTFSGYFQAADATAQIALLSDDGSDVYIDGQQVHSDYQNGHALENLDKSLFPINYTFDPKHVYFIQVVYSNIYLTGPQDIDGATLFCYGGGGSLLNISASLQVRRTGSGNAFGPSAVVAAGPGTNNRADVQVTMTNSDGTPAPGVYVSAPALANAAGASLNAAVSPAGQTADGNGDALFTYSASDQVTTEYVAGDPNSPPPSVTLTAGTSTATINQHWNDILDGSQWGGDDYFFTNNPATIIFSPQYLDGSTAVPITGHTIRFYATSVEVTTFDPNTNGSTSTIYSIDDPSDPNASPPIVNVSSLDQYVTMSPTATEANGVYTGQFTVIDDSVDYVEYDAEDDSAFGDNAYN